jgi:hypothetical protein
MKIKFLIIALLASSISIMAQQKDTIIVDHYKTVEFDCAIFPANSDDLVPGPRFTPTRDDIDRAEFILKRDLKKLNSDLINQPPIIHENLNHYKRQYFGYYDEKGQKILLINCFWDRPGIEKFNTWWLKGMIYVLDGGSNFWSVKYNIDRENLFDLSINGNA